jgi:hypothetical protein
LDFSSLKPSSKYSNQQTFNNLLICNNVRLA